MGLVLLSTLLLVCKPILQRRIDPYESLHAATILPELTPLPADHPFNGGSAAFLDQMPGIGEVYAQRIIDFRESEGLYYFPEDVMYVKGIGEKRFADMMAFISSHPATSTDLPKATEMP